MSRIECQPAFDFGAEIVPFEQTQPPAPYENELKIVEVATDRHLKYDGQVLRITPANFALNALLLTRGKWATHAELCDLVSFPVNQREMVDHIDRLNVDLIALTGMSAAIQAHDKGKAVERRFSPALMFHDGRGSEEHRLLEKGVIGQDEAGMPVFEDIESHRIALGDLFKTYASDPTILRALSTLQKNDETELSAEAIVHKYKTIKAALQNHIFSEEKDEALLRQATFYYYELFLHMYPRVKRIARRAGNAELYDDATQHGSIKLMKVLIDFGNESPMRSIEEKANYFYEYITTSIIRSTQQLIADESRVSEGLQPHEATLTRRIIKQIEELRQKHQTEPTTKQIVDSLQSKGIAPDRIKNYLWRLENLSASVEPATSYLEASDEVERLFEVERIEQILTEARCTINQRVIVSLYFGVWMPSLAGCSFMHQSEETFIYPATRAAFDKLLADEDIQYFKDVGMLIGYQTSGVSTSFYKALKKARELAAA